MKRKGKKEKMYNGDEVQGNMDDPNDADKDGCGEGMTQIFQCCLPGPFLSYMRKDTVVEARVWNRRGVLPACLTPRGTSQLIGQMDGGWFKDVICRFTRTNDKPVGRHCRYVAKFFIKTPKVNFGQDSENKAPCRPTKPDTGEVVVSLGDTPSTIDSVGVRGHAKGLVSRRMIDRLDGTRFLSPQWCGMEDGIEAVRGTRLELRIRNCPGLTFWDPHTEFPTLPLHGIQADCMQSLMKRIYHRAKVLDQLPGGPAPGNVCLQFGGDELSTSDAEYNAIQDKGDLPGDQSRSTSTHQLRSGADTNCSNAQDMRLENVQLAVKPTSEPISGIFRESLYSPVPDVLMHAGTRMSEQLPVADQGMTGKQGTDDLEQVETPLIDNSAPVITGISTSLPPALLSGVTNGPNTRAGRENTAASGKPQSQGTSHEREALLKTAQIIPKVNSESAKLLWGTNPEQNKPALTKRVGAYVAGFLCCVPVRVHRQTSQ